MGIKATFLAKLIKSIISYIANQYHASTDLKRERKNDITMCCNHKKKLGDKMPSHLIFFYHSTNDKFTPTPQIQLSICTRYVFASNLFDFAGVAEWNIAID